MKKYKTLLLINIIVVVLYLLTKSNDNFFSQLFGLIMMMITPITLFATVTLITSKAARRNGMGENPVAEEVPQKSYPEASREITPYRGADIEESEEDEECEEEDSGRYYDGRKVVINNYYQNLEEERLGPVDRVYRDNMKVNRVMGSLYYNFLFRRTMRELAQDISDQTAKKVLRDIGRK